METSKSTLHSNSKSLIIYSPLFVQSKMYSTDSLDSTKSTMEGMYSAKQALSLNTNTPTMAEPKRGNLFQTMFNSLTNIFTGQLAKVPASLINNFSNVNNTLSVTIVPNEGIISQEFFRTLTGHKNNLSDNMYMPRIQNKEPSVDFADTIRLNSKVHIPKDVFLGSTNNSKFPTLDDFDLCLDTEPMFLHVKAIDNNEIITNQTLEKDKSKSGDSKESMEDKIISIDKLTSPEVRQNPESPLRELSQEKSSPLANPFFNMWQKVVNGVSDHFGSFSPALEACKKKYQTVKNRRKANCVSSGRGRGRGKSQLRRSGVSQTKHRKKRIAHEFYSDIQDDLDAWQEFEVYTTPLSCLDQNEDLGSAIKTEDPQNFELIDIKPKKTKKRKNVLVKSESFSMKVKYVPECSLEEREVKCTIDQTAFRSRLISEVSVDSEDSFVVFETGSESDFDDSNCLDENETGDSDTETDSETDNETPVHKVRFNLTPTIHKMVKWDFAYRAARLGPWEEIARDRERFRNRITCIGRVLDPILASDFRTEIWKKRFTTQE